MKKRLLISLFAIFPTLAIAHPGHELASLQAGLMHPLTGWDHLLVMLAVGVWASQLSGHARWQLPLTFVLMMSFGAILGLANIAFSGIETLIAASVLAMGLLLLMRLPISNLSRMGLVAVFAVFHGMAHGVELSQQQGYAVLSGMLVATALLHGVGFCLGAQRMQFAKWLHTVFAGTLMLVGTYLMVF